MEPQHNELTVVIRALEERDLHLMVLGEQIEATSGDSYHEGASRRGWCAPSARRAGASPSTRTWGSSQSRTPCPSTTTRPRTKCWSCTCNPPNAASRSACTFRGCASSLQTQYDSTIHIKRLNPIRCHLSPFCVALGACLAMLAFVLAALLMMLLRLCRAVARGLDPSASVRPTASRSPGQPLRVGFVHPDFGIGGAENLVVNAMLALQRRGVRVAMFTAHHDLTHCFEETRGDGELAHAVHVYGDWLPRTVLGRLWAFCASLRVLFVTLMVYLRHADDVDAFFVDQVSVCVPFLRAFGKPVLFYGHFPDKLLSIETGSKAKAAYRAPLDWIEEITTVSADEVVVNSKFTRSVFQANMPRTLKRELGVLYPPVDVEEFAKFKPSEPRNPHMFVSLNRFERKKNVALAIRALIKMQTTLPADKFRNIKLIVAGGYDPNNRENIEHLNELKQLVGEHDGLADHVEFRTSVSDEMKKTLLATARAVLYTPSNEHFGIVPVEAMTYGTPVIAVNSGGPLESVAHGETGFLCESTPNAFAAAMLQLIGHENDGRAAEMGERGRARARKLFSLKAFGDTLMEFVERLVR